MKGGDGLTGGLIIREYLKDHGITQAFVAQKCGWSRQRTNAILTGKGGIWLKPKVERNQNADCYFRSMFYGSLVGSIFGTLIANILMELFLG